MKHNTFKWGSVVGLVYLLLVAVGLIGEGFEWASGGAEGAAKIFALVNNPIMGLVAGLLATALIQSSSTATSVIVGLVAGGLPIELAIPMIMGANLGTTITNTLVSLGHVKCNSSFERAFSAATVHDFFNLLAVFIFLPLEMFTGILSKSSAWLANLMTGGSGIDMGGLNFMKVLTQPAVDVFLDLYSFFGTPLGGVLLAVTGLALMISSITLMGKALKELMVGRAKDVLGKAIGHSSIAGIASGAAVTVAVQSSSTTTSLIVPLAGEGILKLKDVYPFTLGANIGTTVTALLAATAVTGDLAYFALQIALVHFLFNFLAVLFIYSIPFLRNIPLFCAERFAYAATHNKWLIVAYVVGVFFALPGLLMVII